MRTLSILKGTAVAATSAALLIAGIASAGVGPADYVTDGLVGYWSLDADTVSGDTVEDIWGDNDGVVDGAVDLVDGYANGALNFDGLTEVQIDGTDALNLNGLDGFTAMAWVNAANDSPVDGVVEGCCGSVVAQRDANSWALRYDGRNAGAEMEFIVNTGSWNGDAGFGAPKLTPGEWHHLAGVLLDGNMALYLDGVLLMENPDAGTLASDGPEMEIGRAGDGGFIGGIDEVAIYNRGLSAGEVAGKRPHILLRFVGGRREHDPEHAAPADDELLDGLVAASPAEEGVLLLDEPIHQELLRQLEVLHQHPGGAVPFEARPFAHHLVNRQHITPVHGLYDLVAGAGSAPDVERACSHLSLVIRPGEGGHGHHARENEDAGGDPEKGQCGRTGHDRRRQRRLIAGGSDFSRVAPACVWEGGQEAIASWGATA